MELALALVRIVALHDGATATHLRATATLARRVGLMLGVDEAVADVIELGGLLHDVGKVGVVREVLCKPALLTASEWVTMRRHAEDGSTLLAGIAGLQDLAPIVRAHHERLDGLGYPDGLQGEAIPLEARVVAVADAFHALTTDRPYRPAVLPQVALAVLTSAAGTQFDGDVVDAMHNVLGSSRSTSRRSA